MSQPLRPPPNQHRAAQTGVTMVESAALVSLVGVLLATFTPTFIKHVRLSKVSEATEMLARLHGAAASYYATPQQGQGPVRLHGCLPERAGPTPLVPLRARQSTDFDAPNVAGRATWQALGLTHEEVRYSYEVVTPIPGCAPHPQLPYPAISFRAYGDLDGDGERSSLERSAAVSHDREELSAVGELLIDNRIE